MIDWLRSEIEIGRWLYYLMVVAMVAQTGVILYLSRSLTRRGDDG